MAQTSEPRLRGTVLIADADDESRREIAQALEQEGQSVLAAATAPEAMGILETETVDAVVTDLRLSDPDGLAVFRSASARTPPVPVVVVADEGTVQSAVEWMRRGAVDYLVKPLSAQDVQTSVHRALERRRMLEGPAETKTEEITGFGGLIGTSRAMERIHDQIRRAAPFRSTVLISGESGTGKELVARAIHALSPYSKGPFVAVNCSALPRELVESHLFGHERGAFTGATSSRKGLFEAADGGTLFLDEVGDLALEAQAKLLRTLEDREVTRVGSTRPVSVNVRLLAATNADLGAAVAERRLREDLYYRLNVVSVSLPPLRDRPEDARLLARVFLDRFAQENVLGAQEISEDALACFEAYGWPGNVRELKNVVERLAIMVDGPVIERRDMPDDMQRETLGAPVPAQVLLPFTGMSLDEIERSVIQRTMEETGRNRTEAAKILGISLRTLQRRLRELDDST